MGKVVTTNTELVGLNSKNVLKIWNIISKESEEHLDLINFHNFGDYVRIVFYKKYLLNWCDIFEKNGKLSYEFNALNKDRGWLRD